MGPLCMSCRPGYWGSECAAECPGGSCTPCHGHGTCHAGVGGNGTCACASGPGVGYWDEAQGCGDCRPGYYSETCLKPCPGGATEPCAGHGVCSHGVHGSGQCTCAASDDSGFWAGEACAACTPGYFGSRCDRACPGRSAAGVTCSGQGRCRDGLAGDGACVCNAGYGGPACALTCPAYQGRVCNSQGACNTTTWRCDCGAAQAGWWAGEACHVCAAGWAGPRCDVACLRGAGGAVCSGVGMCLVSLGAGQVVRCECPHGYYGAVCEDECPGGARTPCGGHGLCESTSGRCACLRSATAGHWAGVTCDACAPGWSGAGCGTPCPVAPSGIPCSGFPCLNGACACGDGFCGVACNRSGVTCGGVTCPPGSYGPDCRGQCPHGGAAAAVCSAHGTCLSTVFSSGDCHCDQGYAGGACQWLCPGAPGPICSGHGLCHGMNATCHCFAGFAGRECGVPCPFVAGRLCAGHGTCRDGSLGDGRCTCDAGYAGAGCALLCPGFDPTLGEGAGNGSCSGHGSCEQATARCVCTDTPLGRWSGAACDACASGWFGPTCERRCVHGTTRSRLCVCAPGHGLPDCSAQCPRDEQGAYCSGHGVCEDGRTRTGACRCDADWYTANCSVHCVPDACFPADVFPWPRPHCNATTGQCECQRNATGRWAGPQCNTCLLGFWGRDCDLPCNCNDNGACGALDGVCQCHADPTRGYWAGPHCDECRAGYLEPACRALNVAIARPREQPALAQNWAGGRAIVSDEAHRRLYAGGAPLLVVDTDTDATAVAVELGGAIQSGFVGAHHVYLLVEAAGPGAQQTLVVLTRGPQPEVVQAVAVPGPRVSRRSMRPQSAGDSAAFSAVFPVGADVCHFAFTGVASLTVFSADAAVLSHRSIAGPALQLDTVRGVVVLGDGGNSETVLVAGAWQGHWQVTALQLHGQRPQPLWELLSPDVPVCGPASPCIAAGAVAGVEGDIYVALEGPAGLALVHATLADNRVVHSTRLDAADPSARAVSLSFDPLTAALYVTATPLRKPSIVYKVNAATLMTYGVRRLHRRGGHREVIASTQQDPALRRLYALAFLGLQPLLLTMLLYAVTAVDPPIADVAGGTRLLVAGEGFADLGATDCCFAGGVCTRATWLSPTTAQCNAPPANGTSKSCAGEAQELQLQPGLPTQNNVGLRRIATPSVVSVSPDRGYYADARWVTVAGYGFEASPYLRCRFSAAGGNSVIVEKEAVRYHSGTSVSCRQPVITSYVDGAFPAPSYLEVCRL